MRPAAKRRAVALLKNMFEMSERRACTVIAADRKMVRYRSRRPADSELRGRLRALANQRRRFGYRRLFILLRREGERSGINRIYRLYREEGLMVRKRRGRRKALGTRAPILVEARPNARWSLDFVHDQLANGRRFRILNIVDDVTRECLGADPDVSISGLRVARELSSIVASRGKPKMIVSDNGTELTSNAILAWSAEMASSGTTSCRASRCRTATSILQRAHARRATEREPVPRLADARSAIAAWVADYNNARPHSSLNYRTPAAFAAHLNATGPRAALADGSARRPVAQPAPKGVSTAETLIATG